MLASNRSFYAGAQISEILDREGKRRKGIQEKRKHSDIYPASRLFLWILYFSGVRLTERSFRDIILQDFAGQSKKPVRQIEKYENEIVSAR